MKIIIIFFFDFFYETRSLCDMHIDLISYHIYYVLCLYHPENGRDTDNVIKWT